MIDATSGGALVDKTPATTRQLIENMTSNKQQFNTKRNSISMIKGIHEMGATCADHSRLETKLDNLASMVKQLAMP